MGGSKSSRQDVTQVTTETTTNIGEIGFTGDDAVALAAILEQGSINRDALANDSLATLAQTYGASFNSLVAGAGNLNVAQIAAGESAERTSARALDTVNQVTGAQIAAGESAERTSARALQTVDTVTGAATGVASQTVDAAQLFSSDLLDASVEADRNRLNTANDIVGQTRALAQEFVRAGKESQQILTGQETDTSKVITVAGVVIVAAFGLYASTRR